MPTEFEVTYHDGSRDLVTADLHERVGDEEHFWRASGPHGEERVRTIPAARIRSVREADSSARSACSSTQAEAEALAQVIRAETGLSAVAVDEGNEEFRVDVDLPLLPGEVRVTLSVCSADEWPWLYDTKVKPRMES